MGYGSWFLRRYETKSKAAAVSKAEVKGPLTERNEIDRQAAVPGVKGH